MANQAENQLAEEAQAVAEGINQAIDWVADPENAKLVGERREPIKRELRRSRLQAHRLLDAAIEPMAVAVFGPSQVGKSHLISVLARKGNTLEVEFAGERVNYIRQINPDSGTEATGLVSRFTLRQLPLAPRGFPVSLRLLSPTDLVKIFANAYIYEGNPARYETWPDVDSIRSHINQFRAAATNADGACGLSTDDVWDIAEYLERYLFESELTKRMQDFWEDIASIAGRLPIPQAAKLWSILWGKHDALTSLFAKLVEALSKLGFASNAYCPIDAIDATKQNPRSILDAQILRELEDPAASEIAVARADGRQVQLRRPLLAALTAEIRFNLAEKPWDFFEHTDLLDFPGYRGRGLESQSDEADSIQESRLKGLAYHLKHNPAKTLEEMLLRGKVEYLFQRYMAEQAISAMLLCTKPSNMDVKKLPEVVSQWIASTHGARPQDRLGKPTLLFVVFTMSDIHLGTKESDSALGLSIRFEGRMKASLIEPFGRSPESWVQQWDTKSPFTNSFLMRNPSVREASAAIFSFDGDNRERGILPERQAFVDELRSAFTSVDLVRRHFADPERAFDELMRLNDGGASYIADHLGPVCRPDIKPRQVKNRLEKLRQRVVSTVGPFYVPSDAQKRIDAREKLALQTVDELDVPIANRRFGLFLRGLMLDGADLSDRLYRALMRRPDENDPKPSTSPPLTPIAVGAGAIPKPGRPAATAAALRVDARPALTLESRSSPEFLARSAMRIWFEHLDWRAGDELFASDVLLSAATIREIVGEIARAAVSRGLSRAILRDIEALKFVERLEERLAKAVVIIEHRLNQFVANLGFSEMPVEQRPVVDWGTVKTPVFQARPVSFDIDGLGEQPRNFRAYFIADWTHALHEVFIENARNAAGFDPQNAKQNDRLGKILSMIGSAE
jgi:hypothetical protein